MANLFNSVRGVRPKRNAFNLSHSRDFTHNIGGVVPVFVRDVVPNSDFKVSVHQLTRFQALLAPFNTPVTSYFHFWFLPYRLLDEDFTKWISSEMSDEEYDPPFFTTSDVHDAIKSLNFVGPGSFLEALYTMPFTDSYSGLSIRSNLQITARPLIGFARLIMHWYSNENFAVPDPISDLASNQLHGNISDMVASFVNCLNEDLNCAGYWPHAWAKDYFTSALPFVQAGDPVQISLGGTAPVSIPRQSVTLDRPYGLNGVGVSFGQSVMGMEAVKTDETLVPATRHALEAGGNPILSINVANQPLTGTADLSEASAITINELRAANAFQLFKERLARFGKRYVEYLLGFFNQTSKDGRLQQPEWLGGGKIVVNVSDVNQTSATPNTELTGEGTPLGTTAGKGLAFGTGFAGFKHHFEEHGIIIGVMFLQPKQAYSQGLNKDWLKLRDRFDFFNPSFEHLGEQAIAMHELFFSSSDGTNKSTFGYTPRYAEYKHWENEVLGQFRTNMHFWTMSRQFRNTPALNADFLYTQYDDTTAPFAVQEVDGKPIDHCLTSLYFEVSAILPMSKYGTPMLLN